MRLRRLSAAVAVAALAFTGAASAQAVRPAHAPERGSAAASVQDAHEVCVATCNASLNRGAEGELVRDLSTPDDEQARNIAGVVQTTRPEILLINEFDVDAAGEGARLFQENHLAVGQNGQDPIHYPYRYTAPVNTGVPSGLDLDQSGTVGGTERRMGLRPLPGPVRHGDLLPAPDPRGPDPHVPGLPLGGHARQRHARGLLHP